MTVQKSDNIINNITETSKRDSTPSSNPPPPPKKKKKKEREREREKGILFNDEELLQGMATSHFVYPLFSGKPWIRVKRPFHTNQVILKLCQQADRKELFAPREFKP
jgi:hypothetical protein